MVTIQRRKRYYSVLVLGIGHRTRDDANHVKLSPEVQRAEAPILAEAATATASADDPLEPQSMNTGALGRLEKKGAQSRK